MDFRKQFESLLDKAPIRPTMTEEEKQNNLMKHCEFIHKYKPASLYRYRSCTDYNLDAFKEDQIWLSTASEFNDPYDSLLYFNIEEIKRMCYNGLKPTYDLIQSGGASEILRDFGVDGEDVTNIYKNMDFNSFASTFESDLNDKIIGICQLLTLVKNIIRYSTKMACFSERVDSITMWSHYANNHKGFVLEYDFRNKITECDTCNNKTCNNRNNVTLFPIIYSDEPYHANEYAVWCILVFLLHIKGISMPNIKPYDELAFIKIILHKSPEWANEKEWRIISTKQNPAEEDSKRYSIMAVKPKAIYFGSDISEYHIQLLSTIADEKGMKKYKMYIRDDCNRYEMGYDEIK